MFDLDQVSASDSGGIENATCPAIGAGPPAFGTSIVELLPRSCFYFTVSSATGMAYATCGPAIEAGPLAGPLQPLELVPSLAGATLDRPAIAPEGDRLLIRQLSAPVQRMSWYAKTAVGWSWKSDLFDGSAFTTAGAPSAAPDRRAIVAATDGYHEFVENDDNWTEVRMSPWSTLGVSGAAQPHLSPDGLRLTFVTASVVMYADRQNRDAEFGVAIAIPSIGTTSSAFITEDCARAYYSTNGSIVFRRQR